MHEFVKRYFVENKKLIFDHFGVLSFNTIPAYVDTNNGKLYPLYFNISFTLDTQVCNDTIFFKNLSHYLDISYEAANQAYLDFVKQLESCYKETKSFSIPGLIKVNHFNQAFLVEIDNTLQFMLNPIELKNELEINTIKSHILQNNAHNTRSINTTKNQNLKTSSQNGSTTKKYNRILYFLIAVVLVGVILIIIKFFILKQSLMSSGWK